MKISQWTDQKTWNEFVVGNSQPASFLQSWEWGEFQKSLGYNVDRLGFQPAGTKDRETADILAVANVIKRRLPLTKKSVFYIPRGPVIRKDNHGSKDALIKQLVTGMDTTEATFIRLTPPWIKAHDQVKWENLGFTDPKLLTHQQEPRKTFLTSLNRPDVMLQKMHQKTRYNIRLAQKQELEFKGFSEEIDFEECYKLLAETSKRQGIKGYPKEYYLSLLHRTNHGVEKSNFLVTSYTGLVSFKNNTLACGVWLGFGDTLTYLYGGSTREMKNLMAPYLLHWHALQWAYEKQYTYYDWWGIAETKQSSLSGVTRFKKGFGGFEHTFADTHDFVVDSVQFKLLTLASKLRKIF